MNYEEFLKSKVIAAPQKEQTERTENGRLRKQARSGTGWNMDVLLPVTLDAAPETAKGRRQRGWLI